MGSDVPLYHFLYDSWISYENFLCLCFLLFKWTSHLNLVGFGRTWSFLVPPSMPGTRKGALKCGCFPSCLLILISRTDPRPEMVTITWFFLPLYRTFQLLGLFNKWQLILVAWGKHLLLSQILGMGPWGGDHLTAHLLIVYCWCWLSDETLSWGFWPKCWQSRVWPGLPHSTVAGFQEKCPEKEQDRNHVTLSNLVPEVTWCHSCHLLSVGTVMKSYPDAKGGETDSASCMQVVKFWKQLGTEIWLSAIKCATVYEQSVCL